MQTMKEKKTIDKQRQKTNNQQRQTTINNNQGQTTNDQGDINRSILSSEVGGHEEFKRKFEEGLEKLRKLRKF